ncbi:Alpha-L-fucosidase [Planctomycetes bacterium MalM25]|nr:Alpha-L-fucosidase [Planctomycetes bacterium MalM25]
MNILRLLLVAFALQIGLAAWAEGPYEPNWESLRKHKPAPEWFRDVKYGVYFHWGVYSVPAYGNEWYPNHMHHKSGGGRKHVYDHHVATYGDPSEYGYDKFVPQFKAEHFDAEEWVDLFAKSGAKFVGPVAEHHDGFAMWDSEITPWNSADRGPKKDIVGEITEAARKRGMKTIATFHHARNNLWKNEKGKWTGHYEQAHRHFPEVLEDKERAILYGYLPREEFLDMWFVKLKEVIDGYDPDIIWFDSWLHEIPDDVKMKFLAYYFNHAEETGQEVLVTYKQKDLPQDVGVLDLEKGGMGELTEFTWLTDDTISLGSWCYTENLRIKSTDIVLHSLIDIVSKNGQLVLNVSPKADGSIPQVQRDVLLELGEWLGKYGEAIYETRPFTTYGHGPTVAGKGHFGGIATDKSYTAEDIRYTKNGDTVYAILLGTPTAGAETLLKGFAGSEASIKSVSLLGSDAKIDWRKTDDGLAVTAPGECPDEMANVYRIETE